MPNYRLSRRRDETRGLWAKDSLKKTVYDAALERIDWCYSMFDHVFVSFSGGKDSTAVFQCALEVATRRGKLPLRVVFIDEECISMETEAYVRRIAQRDDVELEWLCLPVRHRNACSQSSPIWWPWDPAVENLWVRDLPSEAMTTYPGFQLEPPTHRISIPRLNPLLAPASRYNSAVVLMGIRAQESIIRRNAISNRRVLNYVHRLTASMSKAYPVYDWLTDDVWLAPEKMGWDYNASYDIMEMAGITRFMQRLAPPYGEEPIQSLAMWAKCFPDLWDKMCERVPGAHTAAWYGKTELYSLGKRTVKPPNITWYEFILERVERQDISIRPGVKSKLRMMINRHHRRTSQPIMVEHPHPESGVSWHLLMAMAERGDMKDRRSGQSYLVGAAYERGKVAYEAELAAWKAAGSVPL